jgi:acyl-coenzyme A thioesterase 9
MEVTITVESCESKAPPLGQERIGSFPEDYNARLLLNEEPILKAKFIMVALDRETGKPTTVPQLRLESERDRELFLEGAEHRARKQVARQISLDKAPPSVEEMILIHSLYREYIQYLDPSFNVEKPENVVWMKDTVKQSLVLCMPQVIRLSFGGYKIA